MASGRMRKIRAQKRQEFEDKQNRNRIVEALNNQQVQTTTIQPHVVTDTDTISTIAQANGTTETDLLAANPELKNLRTGMVINAPRPGTAEWRDRGGIGLPSNAALGGLTNNKRGTNPTNNVSMWGGTTPGYNEQLKPNTSITNSTNPFKNVYGGHNQFSNYQYKPPAATLRPTTYQGSIAATASAITNNYGVQQPPTATSPTPPKPFANTFQSFSMLEENYHLRTLDRVTNTTNYTQADLNYLEKIGLLKRKTPQPAYISSGSSRRKGGGGRGGGGASRAPAARYSEPRPPAFSTGGGFNGLVNWRI